VTVERGSTMSGVPEILREYRVSLFSLTDSERQPVYPKNLGLRTKFGGLPDMIQPNGDSKVTCPNCQQRMHFIVQIDSFEHKSNENPNAKVYSERHFMFGDVGMIYVWFCFDCLTPYATMECY
jgi:hypothetical protein